ncbi:hypothetical protein BGW38_002480 [Lunasporangiospora selenospora]|uniref:B-block binding subunit of TFIIIC domain-containing protein n=1 Tax=Lunasporangiospora selenospora TaxID=979761 RepID=A0A9P6FSA8_9FUNG|nr:hypothetical protein BGW38_002480 [Lunasporangiospora selenospora]
MDNLVLHVLHEVALDGGSGCSWERFWYLVDEFLHSEEGSSSAIAGSSAKITDTDGTKERPPGMDDKFRQFFWTNIIQEEGFLFFNSQQQPSSDAKASNVTRASSVPADTLEPLAVPDISYRNVLLHYKDSIRIASCVERQQLALLGTPGNPGRLSTQAFHILQSITASREFGVTQALLAKEHSIDPRSMFHFLKVLIAMGLIVKIPVTTDGQYTLLCLHKDYAHRNPGYRAMTSEDPFSSTSRPLISGDGGRRFEGLLRSDAKKVSYYSGLIKRKLTDILGRSKTKVMTFEDLLKALDLTDMNTVQNRWFNRQIELLCKLKYIKRVQVQGLNRCIQLIRPFGGNLPPDEPEKDQLTLKALMVDDTNQSGIYIDTSIEHHVYKLIVESEEQGTIAKEIRLAMNRLNLRLLARILDTLCKAPDSSTEPLVKRVVEFVGRERRYRYYSQSGYKASVDEDHRSYLEKAKKAPTGSGSPKATTSSPSASIVVPGPVTEILSESNEPTGTGTEVPSASTPSEPSQAKARSKPRANKPAPATPSVNSQPSQEKALPTASNNATQESDTTPASTASALPESVATPERFVSMALLKRRKILLSLLERHKIVEYQASLVGEYQKEKVLLYPGEEETSVIDRRTLYRTVGILEEEGLCKIFKAQNLTTSSGGTTTKQFCLHSSLEPDSDIVKAFVRESTNRQLLFGQLSSKPPRKLEEVDIEVESLVDLQKRLGGAIENAITIPFTDVGTLRRLRLRDANKASTVRGTDFEGIQYAIQYGWFKAKMMRALVFHRYILDKLSQKDDTIYCRPDYPRTCSTAPIFEVLPLRVYLIAVGIIQEPTAQMHTFLEANRNSNIPLNQLPDYLSCLSVPTPYFRKRLREVFEIMDALGLVKPLEEKDNSTKSLEPNRSRKLEYSSNHLVLHTHYETLINVKAPLDPHSSNKVDDSLHDRKEYMLLSPRECKDFWVDLQTSASSMKTVEPTAGSKSPKTWSDIRRNFLLNLCNRRIWMDPVRITEEQRAKLMAHTDRKRFFVPVADELTIGSIAGETGLDKEHVVRFYRALLHNWNSAATTTLDSPSKTTRLSQVKKARQSLGNRSGPTQPLETQSTPTPSAPAVTPEEGPAKETIPRLDGAECGRECEARRQVCDE